MQQVTGAPPTIRPSIRKKDPTTLTKSSHELESHCTCILSVVLESELALWMRYVCSMYSVSRCRKLRGSLNITGIVIFDNS